MTEVTWSLPLTPEGCPAPMREVFDEAVAFIYGFGFG